jgi:hypothetical protein
MLEGLKGTYVTHTLALLSTLDFSSCLKLSQAATVCKKHAKDYSSARIVPSFPMQFPCQPQGAGVNWRAGGGLTLCCIIIVPANIQNRPKLG